MFIPSNQKKLTNVSIICLKKFNRVYSIPVYPNKLYEYQKNITPLEEVIIGNTLYKNVQTGIKCGKEDLSLFNKSVLEIIREIVDTGHEQKNVVTREYEKEQIETQIIDIVRKKILKNKKFLSHDEMKKVISKYIKNKNIKPQVLAILNILEKEGYERLKMKIQVNDKYIFIDSRDFIKFREECKKNNVEYIVKKNIENYEEEIN